MTPTIPEVFVLWHPACAVGETLARRVYAWLRPGNGLGPEVYYRSLPDPQTPSGLPPPLPGEVRPEGLTPVSRAANLQVALLLIDCHMIADAGWRYWLARLTLTPGAGRRVLLPVALDSTAYNVPESLRPLNFLRPAGLPLPTLDPPGPPGDLEVVSRSLLKQLTETLCWLLLGREADTAGPGALAADAADRPKVTLFLSHAKADGTQPARRIRDYIYSKTQLAAFYDENDIPFGSGFAEVLRKNLGKAHTAALIAVRSARYASRPWCRRELSLFRRPVRDETVRGKAEHWQLCPVLVVDALEAGARTPGIPELGNAPLIRWSDDVPEQEEQIVTTVLRDALLAAFHAGAGRLVRDEPGRIVLNWVPDPTTLLQIPRVRKANKKLDILYPGRGLTGLELDFLCESFPRLGFHSFDQDVSMSTATHRPSRKTPILVGLSVSYQRENLLARGLGLEHLKESLIRLARPLLRHGVNLAYGGHWRETEDNFTFDLLRLISAEQEHQNAADPDAEEAPLGRLFNHAAWPAYLDITPHIEAQWINCCRIVRITQQQAGITDADVVADDAASRQTDRALSNVANTLSAMRRISMTGTSIPVPGRSRPETVPAVAARVVLGGKLDSYSGWLPGIFEEVLTTLEHGAPLYLLGGFGGAAEVLARTLLAPAGSRPEEFSQDWHARRNAKLAKLLALLPTHPLPPGVRPTQVALDALYGRLDAGRASLSATLNTGLDEAQTQDLLTTRDMRRAVELVLKGLAARFSFESLPA